MRRPEAMVWLFGLIVLLVVVYAGQTLFAPELSGSPNLAMPAHQPSASAGHGADAVTLFIALPLLVAAILLYAHSAAHTTRSRK